MSWYLRNMPQFGFDGTRTSDGLYFLDPQTISFGTGDEIPVGYEHYLFWNTTELSVNERVLRTGDAMRLLDVMEAIVIRETWPKTGNGYTGIYLWNRAGLAMTGTGAVESSGSFVDASGPSIGTTDIVGYYLSNAMTLITAQPATSPNQETRTAILIFLQKCRASMLRNVALWTA